MFKRCAPGVLFCYRQRKSAKHDRVASFVLHVCLFNKKRKPAQQILCFVFINLIL